LIAGATYDVTSAYDDQDREYWHQYPDKSSLRIWRNPRGVLASYGHAISFTYEADGTEVRRDINTGVYQDTGYDDDRRRNEVRVHAANGSLVEDLKWSYDDASNIIAIDDVRPGVSADRDRSERYTYDNLYRLTDARGTWGDAHWAYSPSGNLLNRTSTIPAIDAGAFGYGGAGPHAVTSFKGRSIHYDALGRMLDDGDRKYTWDGADHLVDVTSASGSSAESTFDATGMRRVRTERSASGETHTTLFIDPSCEVKYGKLVRFIPHEGRRIAKLSDTNGVPSGAAPVDGGSDDEPPPPRVRWDEIARLPLVLAILLALIVAYRRAIARATRFALPAVAVALLSVACSDGGNNGPPPILGGTIQTLSDADELMLGDAIGSLTEQTSGTGKAKASFAAYPFGLTRYDSSPETRKYANSPRDASVGLDQMGARSFAPDLGVWTSVDPVTLESPERGISADFATDHPYAYAALSPISHSDEDGRCPVAVAALGMFAGAACVVTAAAAYVIQPKAAPSVPATPSLIQVKVAETTIIEHVAEFVVTTPYQREGTLEDVRQEINKENSGAYSAAPGSNKISETAATGEAHTPKVEEAKAPTVRVEDLPRVGTHGDPRAGKDFTPKGRQVVIDDSKARNGGKPVCVDCGRTTSTPQQSKKGVTPPDDETHVDHMTPKSKGGDGSPSNGCVRCRLHNLQKSDKQEGPSVQAQEPSNDNGSK
jgi:RHS repeat-associated protein